MSKSADNKHMTFKQLLSYARNPKIKAAAVVLIDDDDSIVIGSEGLSEENTVALFQESAELVAGREGRSSRTIH